MRAMLFERLVHDQVFISELMTRGVGRLGLDRPGGVRHVQCRRSERRTVQALAEAHAEAAEHGVATMLTEAAVPMAGFEGRSATPVLPDFLVVAQRPGDQGNGSWLIAGDAKDYERIRSRIDDSRLLKGFLQVALGAESVDAWTAKPSGMLVHASGFLAVPRSAYLRPELVVERLDDHRLEVRGRLAQRRALAGQPVAAESEADQHEPADASVNLLDLTHIEAEYDPGRCVTCSLFGYCRDGIRRSPDPHALLVEIGITRASRPAAAPLLAEPTAETTLTEREALTIRATVTGAPQWTRARRVDPVGLPATVNVVLVKSDAAALGVLGVGVQVVRDGGPEAWRTRVFHEPRTPQTRTRILAEIGEAIRSVLDDSPDGRPVHVCVPDRPTADILATMADSAAGVEISRLSWEHDIKQGRPALTFDGEPATIPPAMPDATRLATSFLLDEDRARAFSLRTPMVAIQEVLARHLVPGGPYSDAGRLDYLVAWGEAVTPLDHREVSDGISELVNAPGARTTTTRSNDLHTAERDENWQVFDELVREELAFRTGVVDRAAALLGRLPRSRLSVVHEALEAKAQAVWRRRLAFHASDLVRFSLTARFWRDRLVPLLDADVACARVLGAMLDTGAAVDLARDAGNREYFDVGVVSTTPLVVRSTARALADGMSVVALHVDGEPEVERPDVEVKAITTAFTFKGLVAGTLSLTDNPGEWAWSVPTAHALAVGDRVVVADVSRIGALKFKGAQLNITRPSPDDVLAPKPTCEPGDYDDAPGAHQYCCKSHEVAAAERADHYAARRARGEMNPEVWPPILDVERFVAPGEEALAEGTTAGLPAVPEGATMDDVE